jgi:hypothetical protein
MFLWLDYQFLPREKLIQILGQEDFDRYGADAFYSQPLDAILNAYMFQPMGSSTTAVKEVRIQQIMQAYQLFNMDPMINQIELRKMVLDVLDIKNETRLLQPPPPPTPMPGEGGLTEAGGVPQPGGPAGPGPGLPALPPPPQPPQPGTRFQSPTEQMAEMARVAGGGLVQGTPERRAGE